jgi:hypothetical protein
VVVVVIGNLEEIRFVREGILEAGIEKIDLDEFCKTFFSHFYLLVGVDRN